MLVLRYRSSTKTTLSQDCSYEQFHPLLVGIGVGAVVIGICILVLAVISDPGDIFEGNELAGSLFICGGLVWTIIVEGITQLRAANTQRTSTRRQVSIDEKQTESSVFTIDSGEQARFSQLQQQTPSRPPSQRSQRSIVDQPLPPAI